MTTLVGIITKYYEQDFHARKVEHENDIDMIRTLPVDLDVFVVDKILKNGDPVFARFMLRYVLR